MGVTPVPAIVDYGMGNIGSVVSAFARLGSECIVTDKAGRLRDADAIVLPGVGAFPAAMRNIHSRGFAEALTEAVMVRSKPFLGICLGMQLLANESTEQNLTKGLGWIDGHVTRLEGDPSHPVPHVGWNEVSYESTCPLFSRLDEDAHFYFDHSFGLQCAPEIIAAVAEYGGSCVAAIQSETIFAVQFHPEKSQRNGLRILRNFLVFAAAC